MGNKLQIDRTGRREKTPESIIAKLRRTSIELGRMQDIAGWRITVEDIPEQNRALDRLSNLFPTARIVDRRASPSYGYRTVHLIASVEKVTVEIQMRTIKQDLWASISEKVSDEFGVDLKYGEHRVGPSQPGGCWTGAARRSLTSRLAKQIAANPTVTNSISERRQLSCNWPRGKVDLNEPVFTDLRSETRKTSQHRKVRSGSVRPCQQGLAGPGTCSSGPRGCAFGGGVRGSAAVNPPTLFRGSPPPS